MPAAIESNLPLADASTVFDAAVDLWDGDERTANDFLDRRHPLLDGRTPHELADESPEGAAEVQRLIGQAGANAAV